MDTLDLAKVAYTTQKALNHFPARIKMEVYDSANDLWVEAGWGYQVEGMTVSGIARLFKKVEITILKECEGGKILGEEDYANSGVAGNGSSVDVNA